MNRTSILFLCLTLAACQGDSPAPVEDPLTPGLYAFTNANVWDGTGQETMFSARNTVPVTATNGMTTFIAWSCNQTMSCFC